MVDRTKTKKNLKEQRMMAITPPKLTIDYQVDTLTQTSWLSGYFSPKTNTITINYFEHGDNTFNNLRSVKAHEQKHRDNNKAGMKNLPMNLEQYYKVCCHDEISATIAELLQLRQEYLEAKTDKEREKIMNLSHKFDYYFNAVKNKTINPQTTSAQEFEKEMRFIASETPKMWMNTFSQQYDDNHTSMSHLFFDNHDYTDLKSNPENYEKARKIAYTIGGIDFTQYIKDDITCINKHMQQADKMIAADTHRNEIKKEFREANYDSSLTSITQQAQLQVHQMCAHDLKNLLEFRKQWLACTTDEERKKLEHKNNSNYLAYFWMQGIKEGKFKPAGDKPSPQEQKYIGEQIAEFTKMPGGFDENSLNEYLAIHSKQDIANSIKSGQADQNYKNALTEIYTINGLDYSKYASNPIIDNPNIAQTDRKILQNEIGLWIKKFNPNEDLVIPDFKPISGLSMEQQLRIFQHQIYIANVVARNPQLLTQSSSQDASLLKQFQKDLENNEELKYQWRQAEQNIAQQIAEANKGTVFLTSDNPIKYQQELDKIYTVNGINLKKALQKNKISVENYIPKNKNATINEIKAQPKTERLKNKVKTTYTTAKNWYNQKKAETKNWAKSKWNNLIDYFNDEKAPLKKDTSYRNKTTEPNHYSGKPKYKQWSPEERVSPVLTAEIYDFSAPFLKQHQEQLAKNEAQQKALLAQNKIKTDKFNKKIDETHSSTPTATRNKKQSVKSSTSKTTSSQKTR